MLKIFHNVLRPENGVRIMKSALLFLFILMAYPHLWASDNYAFYLKNGTIVRCQKYQLMPGNVYLVQLDKFNDFEIADSSVFEVHRIHHHAVKEYQLDYKYDSINNRYIKLPDHYVTRHGFFFQWQLSVVCINGMRFIAGYRFNTHVALGLGVGGEYGITVNFNPYAATGNRRAPNYVYNSGCSPFFVFLTGDILKTKVTPFYSGEIGYNLPWFPKLQTDNNDGAVPPPYSFYNNYGGLTTGAGFGCRFYSRRRGNFSISLNVNAGYMKIKTDYPTTVINGEAMYASYVSRYLMFQPSFRLSAGF